MKPIRRRAASQICVSILATVLLTCTYVDFVEAQGSADYVCEAKGAWTLAEGTLKSHDNANLLIGAKFRVSRVTGEMTGNLGFSSAGWNVNVMDLGSEQQSFKVLYSSIGGYVDLGLLEIQQSQKGDVKSFIYLDALHLYTGICSIGVR